MATDTFEVIIPTSTNADETISELERLDTAVREDTRALSNMKRALSNLRGGGTEATNAIKLLKDQMALQRAVVGDTQRAYIEAGGTFRKISVDAKAAGASLKSVGPAASAGADESTTALDAAREKTDMFAKSLARVTAELTRTTIDPTKLDVSQALEKNAQASRRVSVQLRLMKAAGAQASPAIEELERDLSKLRVEGLALLQVNKQLGSSLKRVGESAKSPTKSAMAGTRAFQGWGNAGSLVGGRAGSMISQFESLGQVMQSTSLLTVAATVAVVLLAVAATAAVIALSAYAVALASTKREQALMLEGTVALAAAMSKTTVDVTGQTESLAAAISNVAGALDAPRTKTRQLGIELFNVGLRGRTLQAALLGITTASLAAGKAGEAAFKKQLGPIKNNEAAVAKLAQKFDKDLGGVAAKRALGLGNQLKLLKEDLARTFGDLKIDGFLRGFAKIRGMFAEGSAVSLALKGLFEDLFGPLEASADGAALVVVRAFKRLIIAGLNTQIGFLILKNKVLDMFDAWNKMSLGEILLEVAGFVAKLQAALVTGVVKLAGDAGELLFKALKTAFDPQPAGKLGEDLVDGIIAGIVASGAKLVKSVTNLASSAIKAFKGVIKSSSPSKVFMNEGVNVGEGAAAGVEASTPAVHKAIVDMAKPPDELGAAQAASVKAVATAAAVDAPAAVKPAAVAAPRINAPSLTTVSDAPQRAGVRARTTITEDPREARAAGTTRRAADPGDGAPKGGGQASVSFGDVNVTIEAKDKETAEELASRIRQPIIDELAAVAAQIGASK